jgi:uncharacterized membrane protein YccC
MLDAPAAALHARIDALAPQAGRGLGWNGLIELNLAARLRRLVDLCVETRTLRQHIDAGVHGKLPDAVRRLPGVPPSALHQDRGMALLSAFAAIVATLSCCAFWILTGWPSGAAAPMMAAVLCCFFSTQDDPVPFIKGFLVYTIYSIPVSALYILGILPAIHSFEMLTLVCAPTFLLVGVWIARPSTFGRAMPWLFGLCGTLALLDTHTVDIVSFTNGTLAQILGLVAAAVTTSVLRRLGAGWTARRLLKAGWRELARLGSGQQPTSLAEFSARMVDRVGLLTPRLALASPAQDLQAADALRDLRIGLNMRQPRRGPARGAGRAHRHAPRPVPASRPLPNGDPMIGEVSIYGLYLPPLLLLTLGALAVSKLLNLVLARTGFYRLVWHPALFDFSLFVIVLGALTYYTRNWA